MGRCEARKGTGREEYEQGMMTYLSSSPPVSEFAATTKGEEAPLEPPHFTPSSCSFSWHRKRGGVKPTATPFQLV